LELVRDILVAHRSGISRPGLLAWARLRGDAQMTDAQLEAILLELGDEVVDVEGFLYLRRNAPASAQGVARTPVPPTGAAVGRPSSSTPAPPGEDGWRTPDGTWVAEPRVSGRRTTVIAAVLVAAFAIAAGIAVFVLSEEDRYGAVSGERVDWTDLEVGDCFQLPNENDPAVLDRVTCDSSHDYEVFDDSDYPGTAFPSDDAFNSYALARCDPAFATYTGSASDEQTLLQWYWWAPTKHSWAVGARTFQCFLGHADETPAKRSYRAATP
jgi:hypothetical protein